jgi:hypothetical protein
LRHAARPDFDHTDFSNAIDTERPARGLKVDKNEWFVKEGRAGEWKHWTDREQGKSAGDRRGCELFYPSKINRPRYRDTRRLDASPRLTIYIAKKPVGPGREEQLLIV